MNSTDQRVREQEECKRAGRWGGEIDANPCGCGVAGCKPHRVQTFRSANRFRCKPTPLQTCRFAPITQRNFSSPS